MDETKFEELLYTNFSENPFKNQRVVMKNSEDDWNISDHMYQHFGIKFG